MLYPHQVRFSCHQQQKDYMLHWLSDRAGLGKESDALDIHFYPARWIMLFSWYYPHQLTYFLLHFAAIATYVQAYSREIIFVILFRMLRPECAFWRSPNISTGIPDQYKSTAETIKNTHTNRFQSPLIGRAWTDKFRLVVGVAHTNYLMYARVHGMQMAEPILFHLNRGMHTLQRFI